MELMHKLTYFVDEDCGFADHECFVVYGSKARLIVPFF